MTFNGHRISACDARSAIGAAASSLAQPTHALDFDGVDDYVLFGATNSTDPPEYKTIALNKTAHSWQFTFKPAAMGGIPLGHMRDGATFKGFGVFYESTGEFAPIYRSDTTFRTQVKTIPTYATGAWYNVIWTVEATYDAADLKVYVNGSLVSTTTVADLFAPATHTWDYSGSRLQLSGRGNGANTPITGRIGGVAMYNSVLTQAAAEAMTDPVTGGFDTDAAELYWPVLSDTWTTGLVEQKLGGSTRDGTLYGMTSGDVVEDSPW